MGLSEKHLVFARTVQWSFRCSERSVEVFRATTEPEELWITRWNRSWDWGKDAEIVWDNPSGLCGLWNAPATFQRLMNLCLIYTAVKYIKMMMCPVIPEKSTLIELGHCLTGWLGPIWLLMYPNVTLLKLWSRILVKWWVNAARWGQGGCC